MTTSRPATDRVTGGVAAPDAPLAASHGDDDLAARMRVAVTRLNRRLRQQSLAGLSPAQTTALASINRLGTPTLGQLAVVEQVQPPTMTRLVGSMETAGLVTRMDDAQDGRVCRVRLTAEGRRALERIRTMKAAYLTRRFAALAPAEKARLEELTALLERLVADE